MKKKINKALMWLYFSVVVLTIFVCTLIDTTSDGGFKAAVPICFGALVVSMIAFCFSSKTTTSIVDSIDEESYAVIDKDVYVIKVIKEEDKDVIIKLTRKK